MPLHREGCSTFSEATEDGAESWYQPACDDPELFDLDTGWEKALEDLWRSQHREDLATLVDSFSKLARTLELQETEEQDVSPFIYVMY